MGSQPASAELQKGQVRRAQSKRSLDAAHSGSGATVNKRSCRNRPLKLLPQSALRQPIGSIYLGFGPHAHRKVYGSMSHHCPWQDVQFSLIKLAIKSGILYFDTHTYHIIVIPVSVDHTINNDLHMLTREIKFNHPYC